MISIIRNRTFWTWRWMKPYTQDKPNSKSQGRVDWTGQSPSSPPPPPLPLWATVWATIMLTMTTTAALTGYQTSGARPPSPNRSSYPSGPTAPWASPSPAAPCSPLSDSWRTWMFSPRSLPLLWLLHRASLPQPACKPSCNQCYPPTVTRLSCAAASRRQAAASMAPSASSPMVRKSCVDCTATPSTRQSPAEPSTTLGIAHMAHAATLSMRIKSATARCHLQSSRINWLPVVRVHAINSARVSASQGSSALHAPHLLPRSLHPSLIST